VRGAVRIFCSQEHHPFLLTLPVVRVGSVDTRILQVGGMATAPIVWFEGMHSRNDAEALRGLPVLAPRDLLPEPDEDEFFLGDLNGCSVVDLAGKAVGQVTRADALPANAVLTVKRHDGSPDLLVPFVREVVPGVDLDTRTLTVDVEFLGG